MMMHTNNVDAQQPNIVKINSRTSAIQLAELGVSLDMKAQGNAPTGADVVYADGAAEDVEHEKEVSPESDIDVEKSQQDPADQGEKKFELTDQTIRLPTKQLLIVLAASSSCILLSFLDQTIVATALPIISSYFRSGKESSWVATAYLVASTATQPLYGRFSDIFGRKVVLLVAVAMFTVFSLACAVAQTMLQLIIFRGFQGAFGGGLLTMVMIVMSDLISLKDRGKYQGVIEGVIAISNGVGPILGAVFSEKASWRWCFWINLPLCGMAALLLIVFLPSKPTNGDVKAKLKAIDYFGCVSSLAATILLLIGLTWGGITYPWVSAQVLAPLVVAGLLAVTFMVWEGRVAMHPIIPLKVFKIVTSAGILASTFLLGASYYILLYYIPNFLQVVRGHSAVLSSALLLPFVLLATFVVETTGIFISKFGRYREFIIAGYSIWAAGVGSLTTLDAKVSNGKVVGLLLLNGLGAGMTLQSTVIAIMAAFPDRRDVSVAVAVRNYVRLLGGSIFLAVATTIVNNGLRNRLSGRIEPSVLNAILDDPTSIQHSLRRSLSDVEFDTVIEAYVQAFRTLFFVVMGLLLAAAVICFLFVRHHSLKRDDEAKLKEEGKKFLEEQKERKRNAKARGPDDMA